MLQGFVCAVDKQNAKSGADAYRPICALSVIYRVWASIRTRQLLRAMSHALPEEIFGFAPGREAADLWFRLQARIELACQQGRPLTGCVADIVKAFNGLPRAPLLQAAARLGFPLCVLTPWVGFISGVQRRFIMGEAVSEAVSSCSGFIEGDPLSVTAMTVASILFHRYLQVFEPCIQHASYVDNLALTADSVYYAAKGHILVESFWQMLGLQLDASKTYFWATTKPDRKLLIALGLQVAEHQRELGGFLNFGPRRRTVDLLRRLELLQPFWHVLRCSKAPLTQKWAAVTTKLWPIVFHGTTACWLPAAQLDKLRTKMAWALGWTCAGAGPDLRALTEGPMELDPCFFQIWSCFRDFRRLVPKCAGLYRDWVEFLEGFDGRGLAGPFSTLLHHAHSLGWGFAEAPFLTDHRGLSHNFLTMPKRSLYWLLQDAWAWKVLQKQSVRAGLADVGKLDIHLAREVGRKCTGQQRQWLGQIRSGAAITAAQQAKFDCTKISTCLHCGVEDDKCHRLFDCPQYGEHDLAATALDTKALCNFLLPSWHEDLDAHLRELMDVQDGSWTWQCGSGGLEHVDIFTDGSCQHGDEDILALGAWAVVGAQLGQIIASGVMTGICQTIDRCELLAAVVALRWAVAMGCGITLWTDSKFVFDGLRSLVDGLQPQSHAHPDLWLEAKTLLETCHAFFVQLVLSHVDPDLCEDPVAEWATCWNRAADRQASFMNYMRTLQFKQRHGRLLQQRKRQRRRLKMLQGRYLQIAEHTLAASQTPNADPEDVMIGHVQRPECICHDSFADLFPVDWRKLATIGGGFETTEGLRILQLLVSGDESALTKFRVTWIELVFFLVGSGGCSKGNRTLASWVTSIRKLVRPFLLSFGARSWLVWSGLEGVSFSLEALIVGFDVDDLMVARRQFQEWRGGRSIRRVADLARPL